MENFVWIFTKPGCMDIAQIPAPVPSKMSLPRFEKAWRYLIVAYKIYREFV